MSMQELIELAILDAMGLLDEEERIAFELAFRGAAPAVQAQVRREQTRLSRIEDFLPRVDAPAGLRAAVIEAVRREIAAGQAASMNPALLVAESMVRPRTINPLWRTAALGLAAAAIVFGITTFQWQARYKEITDQLQANGFLEAIQKELKGDAGFIQSVLFSKDTRRVVFSGENGYKGEASLFLNPEWKDKARFFCRSINSGNGKTLKLALIDQNDRIIEELATFTSQGELLPLEVPIASGKRGKIAVMTSGKSGRFDEVIVKGDLPAPAL
ncbi:MAG: hypothetical protein WD749_02095 [Phycisphaerales bacterium]